MTPKCFTMSQERLFKIKKIMFDNNVVALPDDFDVADMLDRIESAPEQASTSLPLIVDFLQRGQIGERPNIQTMNRGGVAIKDPMETYLSNTGYHSTGPFVALSLGTPLDFEYYHSEEKKALDMYKDKSHFDLGTFVHEAILEPEKWDNVICEPSASRASHAGLDSLIDFWDEYAKMPRPSAGAKVEEKKAWIDMAKEASGKSVISTKDAMIVQRIHAQWLKYEGGFWSNLIGNAHKEVSIYADDFMGLPMRVRPDALLFAEQIGVNAIVSVKSTRATSVRQYVNQFYNLGYATKEAAYQRIASHVLGIDFTTTINIVVSTAEPFNVGVFIVPNETIALGGQIFSQAVINAKLAMEQNYYPGWEIKAGIGNYGIIELK